MENEFDAASARGLTPPLLEGRTPLTAGHERVCIADTPTPLQFLPRLTQELDGPNVFVKRDDNTGFAMGGNKVRQMEYVFGQVVKSGADAVLSTSAIQSNHLRVISALAARFGLRCEIQRENRVPGVDADYAATGNAFLQDLFGARIHNFPIGEDEEAADAALNEHVQRLRDEGFNPYVIGMGPKHPHFGALGYVDAAVELAGQAEDAGFEIDTVVLPSGSAATHAGMLVGLRALGHPARVIGVCIRRHAAAQHERVWQRARETAALIGRPDAVAQSDIHVRDEFLGPGYGQPTEAMIDAITHLARTEALLLDPIYSGKAMSGLIGMARDGTLPARGNVVFVHTGGLPALFAYKSLFA